MGFVYPDLGPEPQACYGALRDDNAQVVHYTIVK